MNNHNNDKKEKEPKGIALGAGLGLLGGVVIGTLTDNIGLWIPVGLCLGVALGNVFDSEKDGEDEDIEQE